jgi:O-antigen ligase
MERLYKSIIFIALAAVLIFSPIARGAVRLWSVTPVLLALYAIIFIWAIKVANQNGYKFKATPLDKPLWIFAILAATSFALSIYKHDSFYALLRLFAYIGLYYAVVNEFDHKARRRIIWLVISIGGALSAYGLLQYFGIFSHSWWIPKQFLAATYVNHNHFAGYLELAIPVALAMLTARSVAKSTLSKLALVSALVPMLLAFVLTQSRGAWVSLGASLLIMLFLTVSRNKSWARLMVIIVFIVVIAVSVIYFAGDMMSSRIATITAVSEGEDVSGGRFRIWQGAAGMIKERPLTGVGIGDFDHGFYRYRPPGFNARAVYAHNDYLHMAAEMGVFAPVIMLWLFIAAIRAGFRKRDRSPYAFGCAIGVMSLALHAIVDFNFHIPANMILFTVWLGIITSE